MKFIILQSSPWSVFHTEQLTKLQFSIF
jgi:hypothetical protein